MKKLFILLLSLAFLLTTGCTAGPNHGVEKAKIDEALLPYSQYTVSGPLNHTLSLSDGLESMSFSLVFTGHAFEITANLSLFYKWNYDTGVWELENSSYTPTLHFIRDAENNSIPLIYTSGTKPNSIKWTNDNELYLDYDNVFHASYFANKCHILMSGGADPVYRIYVYDKHKVAYSIDIERILETGCIELNVFPGFFYSDMFYIY